MHVSSGNWCVGIFRRSLLLLTAVLINGFALRLARLTSRSREAALLRMKKFFPINGGAEVKIHFAVNEFSVGLTCPQIELVGYVSQHVKQAKVIPSLINIFATGKTLCIENKDDGTAAIRATLNAADIVNNEDSWVRISLSSGSQAGFVLPWHIESSDFEKWRKIETDRAKEKPHLLHNERKINFCIIWWIPSLEKSVHIADQIRALKSLNETFSLTVVSDDLPFDRLIKGISEITWQKVSTTNEVIEVFNATLSSTNASHVLIMQGSLLLRPDSLMRMRTAIQSAPEDSVHYFDHDFFLHGHRLLPQFKPGFGIESFQSTSYLGPLVLFSKNILMRLDGFHTGVGSGFVDDAIFRCEELGISIFRTPEVLYHQMPEPYNLRIPLEDRIKVIEAHQSRKKKTALVVPGKLPGTLSVKPRVNNPSELVSIIIPNKDHYDVLKNCVNSLIQKTSWENYEILIIENNSVESPTFELYNELAQIPKLRIIEWQKPFNYAAINNFAVQHSRGNIIIFLNNDVELISPDWIETLVGYAQQQEVGAVGARLLYPDGDLQHGGVVLGIGGVAAHIHSGAANNSIGYLGRLTYTHNVSAVTGACLTIRRDVFEKIGGFDEGYAVAFNDIDLCCKVVQQKLRIVQVPEVELFHFESRSRGAEDTPEKLTRFQGEVKRFQEKWSGLLALGDCFYNPNLSLEATNCSLRLKY